MPWLAANTLLKEGFSPAEGAVRSSSGSQDRQLEQGARRGGEMGALAEAAQGNSDTLRPHGARSSALPLQPCLPLTPADTPMGKGKITEKPSARTGNSPAPSPARASSSRRSLTGTGGEADPLPKERGCSTPSRTGSVSGRLWQGTVSRGGSRAGSHPGKGAGM